MATKPKRVLKKAAPTVREQVESQANPKERQRIVRTSARKASTPFRALFRLIGRLLRPFRFLLSPFKTRPARFVGRILAKVFLVQYFRNAWKEVRQVTWPDRKQTFQLTLAVFIFAVVFGLMIAITDFGLNAAFEKILL